MPSYFGLFLRDSTGYCDIAQERNRLRRSRSFVDRPSVGKREDVCAGILFPVFPIQGFDAPIRKNRDVDGAPGRAGRDAGEPSP
jgi:hypothetical protein